jgi:hypothetical protein
LFVNGQAYKGTPADLVWFVPLQNHRTLNIQTLNLDKPSQHIIARLLDDGALVIRDSASNE